MPTVSLPTSQFRSIPSPTGTSKVGLFYVRADQVSEELWNWREVNPREVNTQSQIYRAIEKTLEDEPGRFHERNRGLTIVADELLFDDKNKQAQLRLGDLRLHGVVDGAHTLHAILKTQKQPPSES